MYYNSYHVLPTYQTVWNPDDLFQDNNHPGCFNACGQSRRHYKNDAAYTITVFAS